MSPIFSKNLDMRADLIMWTFVMNLERNPDVSGEAQTELPVPLTSLACLRIMQLLTFFNRHIQDMPQDSCLLWYFFQNALLHNLGYIWWPQFLKCNMLILVVERKAVSSSRWMRICFLESNFSNLWENTPAALKRHLFPSQHRQVTSECKTAQENRMSKSHYAGTGCLAFDILPCPCPLTAV